MYVHEHSVEYLMNMYTTDLKTPCQPGRSAQQPSRLTEQVVKWMNVVEFFHMYGGKPESKSQKMTLKKSGRTVSTANFPEASRGKI
jgi:hypothetical protein